MANFTNHRYIDPDHTIIDMDLEHPVHGWVPITINEAEYPSVWAEVVAAEPRTYIPPTPEEIRAAIERQVREDRAQLLQEIDQIAGNYLRWTDLTSEQQQALGHYRHAVLGITDQPGFPEDVLWPTKPEGIF